MRRFDHLPFLVLFMSGPARPDATGGGELE
jgi:hypothetical protein